MINRETLNSKQLRAISVLQEKVEKGGKINLWEILRESWYSPNTAKTPQKVFAKPIMKKKLKELWLNRESARQVFKDAFNANKVIIKSYPIAIPKEDIISAYDIYLDWVFLSSSVNTRKGQRSYHFIVPDHERRVSAVVSAYTVFPQDFKEDDTKKREKNNEIRSAKIDEIMEKHHHLLLPSKIKNI